jgi:hypothetical protein
MLSTSKCALCILLTAPLFATLMAAGCDVIQVDGGTTGGHPPGDGEESSSSSASSGGTGGMGGALEDAGPDAVEADAMDSSAFLPVTCYNYIYSCGDGIDNDNDGLIDSQDPDCLGACDNSEDGLHMAILGSDCVPCMTDCFWDPNSGSGNDGCYWNHKCDPLSVPPYYYPESWVGSKCAHDPAANTPGTSLTCDQLSNEQSLSCRTYCAPLIPNGCDCFGCCVVHKDGIEYGPVFLNTQDGNGNSICTFDNIGDPSYCAPCTQVKNDCNNPCETCELCVGKTTLPPECQSSAMDGGSDTDGGDPSAQCPAGIQPCGLPGQGQCALGHYCITGCCIPIPL